MQAIKKVRKAVDFLLVGLILFLFLMMFGFTNGNVIMRYCFNRPIVISNEIARYAYVDLIFIGAIFTMRADKHLSLDFFVGRMPRPICFFFTMFGRLLTEVFLVIFTYYAMKMVTMSINIPSTAMQIPMSIPYAPLVIGGIGMFIEEAILIVTRFRQYKTHTLPEDLPMNQEAEVTEWT